MSISGIIDDKIASNHSYNIEEHVAPKASFHSQRPNQNFKQSSIFSATDIGKEGFSFGFGAKHLELVDHNSFESWSFIDFTKRPDAEKQIGDSYLDRGVLIDLMEIGQSIIKDRSPYQILQYMQDLNIETQLVSTFDYFTIETNGLIEDVENEFKRELLGKRKLRTLQSIDRALRLL